MQKPVESAESSNSIEKHTSFVCKKREAKLAEIKPPNHRKKAMDRPKIKTDFRDVK